MGKAMGLYMQGYSDEDIMQQTGIDEETLSIIKERQGRMMDRAREMSAMYGGSIPQQFSQPRSSLPGATLAGAPSAGIAKPEASAPGVTTPSVPIPSIASPVKQRSKVKVFFRKKQVVIFLIGLALSTCGGLFMGFITIQYTAMWWLIVLEIMVVNIIFQIILGIVAFKSHFRTRTYKAAAYADTDGDGKYDEAAFASKTVSGTSVKLKALAIVFIGLICITVAVFTQFGIGIQYFSSEYDYDIILRGDYIAYFFILHCLGALIGGWGLTRG